MAGGIKEDADGQRIICRSKRYHERSDAVTSRLRNITCQRGSARQCCKGHVSFLWEKPIFDLSQKPNPSTYNHKNSRH
jgi:hypothetical protein